jgi:NAD-dependent dihydropyrimidine dehydrogenase PreA subunit/coenzyme F420-reducing hydrogenase delta subunit
MQAETENREDVTQQSIHLCLEETLCARYRTTKSQCQKCLDFCPVPEAIRITEEGVEITEKCIACGVCYSVCPNGALLLKDGDEHLSHVLTQLLTEHGNQIIRVTCQHGEEPAEIRVHCLSRLTEAFFLDAFRLGASNVEILQPTCKGCSYAKASPWLENVVTIVKDLLTFVGIKEACVARRVVPFGIPNTKNITEHEKAGVSRRSFLGLCSDTVISTTLASIPILESEEKTETQPFHKRVKQHPVNRKREHLLATLSAFSNTKPQEILLQCL